MKQDTRQVNPRGRARSIARGVKQVVLVHALRATVCVTTTPLHAKAQRHLPGDPAPDSTLQRLVQASAG